MPVASEISASRSVDPMSVLPSNRLYQTKQTKVSVCASRSAWRVANASQLWGDGDVGQLEGQLTDVLVDMLLGAEASYRNDLVRNREWIIERKAEAEAEAELKRRKDEVERKARELQEKLERERIGRLLSQAKALNRASQIRIYVESVRLRTAEMPITQNEFEKWATWAQNEADRIDPVKNGTIAHAIKEHFEGS
jgi:hypothetical protein